MSIMLSTQGEAKYQVNQQKINIKFSLVLLDRAGFILSEVTQTQRKLLHVFLHM